jgi:hypothetical protein
MVRKRHVARYAVEVTKESVEEWTLYVSANSPKEANEAADEIVQNCMFPEYEFIIPSTPRRSTDQPEACG